MQELTQRFDQLIELVIAQNKLLDAQNELLRTFVEAMVREEAEQIPAGDLSALLKLGGTVKPNISTMDRDETD